MVKIVLGKIYFDEEFLNEIYVFLFGYKVWFDGVLI